MKIREISENISHTSKRLRDIERKKGVKPGTPEWFKLWFSLPYLIKESTLVETYKMRLERGDDMDTLHIVDTRSGKRTEVRGKPGYETNGYDPECPLHQLLDKIGKAANISELMNGEVVTINPKHPQGDSAKAATTRAFNEETGKEMLKVFRTMHHDTAMNKDMDNFILAHDWELRDFTPDMFPGEEEFFDYDDPFDRVIDIDYSHRVDMSAPIIVGPQFSDGKYSVIDGNHRAAAAQRMGKTIKGYFPVKKINEAEGLGLTIFDIDETLVRTTAQIKVVKDGKVIRSLTNQEFNNYKLQPDEEFDFGEFRNAEKFRKESEPIGPMIAKLKSILRNAGDSKIIMLTARADFDDKETFLDTFRDMGIDMSRVHVHRAGNLGGSPAQNKAVWIRKYLDTGKYARVRLYDDAMSNIRMFNEIAKEYPDIKFYPYLVTHDGSVKTVREYTTEVLNTQATNAKWTMSSEDMSRLEFTASNGIEYQIDFLAPFIGPDEIHPDDFIPDISREAEDSAVFVEFSQKNATGAAKQGVAGTGAAAEVFGIVTNTILEFAKKRKPSMIYFQAAEVNRRKLYAAIANRLVKSMSGYTVKQMGDKFAVYSNALVNPATNENFAENKIKYSASNFEYEWEEALRYPEFRKIGKAAWIELAGKGRAVTIRSAKGINNTDAADPNSFKMLDKTKQARALDQLKSGTVEMPIVAVYSDGWKELIGGNTRLTAMLAQNGEATVWVFKVPDEVAELAENFADGKKPGRKGLAKRMGVDCSKSETELRKIAKRSSGEKQRMAHWCANMKGGKKK
jgi:hypothetical protein